MHQNYFVKNYLVPKNIIKKLNLSYQYKGLYFNLSEGCTESRPHHCFSECILKNVGNNEPKQEKTVQFEP